MEVVVVGAGKVGFAIAEKLTAEQHNVVVIDLRADRLTVLNEALDVMTIEGSGACGPMLEQAEIRKADLFIAVTNVDEINLVACQLAKYYGVPRRIARIGNLLFLPSDGGLKASDFGVDLFINPEQVCAQELSRLLRFQAVNESQEFCDGRVMLIALTAAAPNPLIGQSLVSFQDNPAMQQVRLVAISRDGETIIPRGGTSVQPGDDLYFMAPTDQVEGLFDFLGIENAPPQRVLIVGGGEIGLQTARLLEDQNVEVHLLEENEERAEYISQELHKALVFKGNARNLKDLRNAGLGAVDGYVATCGDDEVNILSCLMSKQAGARKTLAIIRKPEYLPLLSSIKVVDAAVSPRLITASAILRFIRRGKILSAVTVRDIEAEVIEIEVEANSKINGKKIRQISFPKDAVMGCIVRGNRVLPAQGDETLLEKDRVVVLTRPKAIRTLENIFAKKARGLIL
jgi:trk system potassium uptake protein TrkA